MDENKQPGPAQASSRAPSANQVLQTGSPYMFKPILEPPDEASSTFLTSSSSCGGFSGGGIIGTVSTPSGGGAPPGAVTTAAVQRIRMNSGGTPIKLHTWRANSDQAAWSSQGSRHSSRPGSAASSSRPPSQAGPLYSRSNNSSLSDVSVAKNFQQLSVSTKRAYFKTQKWSHSFDQPTVGAAAAPSPARGRRQQHQHHQHQHQHHQQKSLDLDSGYVGSGGDLRPRELQQELHELQQGLELETNRRGAAAAAAAGMADLAGPVAAAAAAAGGLLEEEDDLSRSSSLPSFPDSFNRQLDQVSHLALLGNSVNTDDNLDDLDEEIKAIVASGPIGAVPSQLEAAVSDQDEVLSFIGKHCPSSLEDEDYGTAEVLSIPPVLACISNTNNNNILSCATANVRKPEPLSYVASCASTSTVFNQQSQQSQQQQQQQQQQRRLQRLSAAAAGGSVDSSCSSSTTSSSCSSSGGPRKRLARSWTLPEEATPQMPSSSTSLKADPTLAPVVKEEEHEVKSGDQDRADESGRQNGQDQVYGRADHSGCSAAGCSEFGVDPSTDSKMHLETLSPFNPHYMGPVSSGSASGPMMATLGPFGEPMSCTSSTTASAGLGTSSFQLKEESCLGQTSPMAISPSMSTLNTPRGSITSMTTDAATQQQQQQQQHQQQHHQQQQQTTYLDESLLMQSYQDPFDPTGHADPPLGYQTNINLGLSQYYPSPPRSAFEPTHQTLSEPPSYAEHMQYASSVPTAVSAAPAEDFSHALGLFEPEVLPGVHAKMAGSEVFSDTGPETPDSSVKEELGESASPDVGPRVCLWQDCHEVFSSKGELVDHVGEVHMETKKGSDEYPCLWQDCPRRVNPFNAKYKLVTHMRVHTKDKPYKCTYEGCQRSFARLENRKIHGRSHTGDKPFSCKYAVTDNCKKRFSNSSDRAKHEQTHKDPKPYCCKVPGCTKRYTDPSSLRKHVKSHSQEEQLQSKLKKEQTSMSWRSNSSSEAASHTPFTATATVTAAVGPSATPTTLLSMGLQAGGTMLNLEEVATPSPGSAASPLQQALRSGSQQPSVDNNTTTPSRGDGSSYPDGGGSGVVLPGGVPAAQQQRQSSGALAHQPNSLDDLDEGTLPFDDIPVRYDSTDTYELPSSCAWSTAETTSSTTQAHMQI